MMGLGLLADSKFVIHVWPLAKNRNAVKLSQNLIT